MNFKVLVISHNCFSSSQNMGKTLRGLFGVFKKEQIYQLYFHSSYPDIDICQSFFRITDAEVLHATLTVRNKCGAEIDKSRISNNNSLFDDKRTVFSNKAKKKRKYLIAARDILWSFRKWDTKELDIWLDRVNPDVIFLAAGDAVFSYSISLIIAKRRKIPLVIYFCDDYYTFKARSLSLAYQMQYYFLKTITRKAIVSCSKALVYISKSMEEEYGKLFGKSGDVIMTPYLNKISSKKNIKHPLIMTYAGNISLNRWKTLRLIGEALAKINDDVVKAILNVYSRSQDQNIIRQLTIENAMYFKGSINYDEQVKFVIEESDVLVHVESFYESDIKRVRHSISTKIADYLASNRLIMAVGPKEVASISYLKNNNAAYVIDNIEDLQNNINKFLELDQINIDFLINNAMNLACTNHDESINSNKLYKIMQDVIDR